MRILYVGTYASWEKVSKGKMPSHHMFGVHELVHHYEENNGIIRGILSGGGYVDFYLVHKNKKLPKRINQMLTLAEIYLKSFKYDCIYDTLNQCTKVFSILRKFKMMPAKVVGILHHPPFNLELNHGKADAYIFFNNVFKEYAIDKNPDLKDRYFVNEWYPDERWYNTVTADANRTMDCFFVDNGKTKRDHKIVEDACVSLSVRCMTPGDASRNSLNSVMQYYTMDLSDDVGMARRLCSSRVILIPIQEQSYSPVGPYGITSFLDGVALKLPIICSDNCCFASEVLEFKLGLTYITGNRESLEQAMKKLHNDTEFYAQCVENLKRYSNGRTIQKYSDQLSEIITSI